MGILDGNNGKQDQQPPVTSGKEKLFKYRCKCDCTYGGELHREGDTFTTAEKLEVPHFELVEEK